jgi:hypothetical protein|tara:strand:+ start:286 stop:621 length:336 start_codon:yes stop_codon:yes gene_type:complete
MAKYATGRYAKRISDRSGMAFPYNEMVKEWNGSTVHTSEFESKHPQLDPRYHPTDPQSLQNAKPQIIGVTVLLGINLIANNIFQSEGMQPVENNKNTKINSFVGTVEVAIT